MVVDMADGILEETVKGEDELQNLREAVSETEGGLLRENVQVGTILFMKGSRLVTDLSNVAVPIRIQVQRQQWVQMPLSAFGEALRAAMLIGAPLRVKQVAEKWRQENHAL